MAESSDPEKIGPERTLPSPSAHRPVFSPTGKTFGNKKIDHSRIGRTLSQGNVGEIVKGGVLLDDITSLEDDRIV